MNITPFFLEFPTQALPDSMCKAASEVGNFTQAPPALVAAACLASASVATQNLADVQRREGLVGPIGLFLLTIGGSGERKSTVDTQFTRTIREIDRANDLENEAATLEYKGEYAVWRVKKESAAKDLQRAISEGSPTDAWEERLAQIVKSAPQKPVSSPLLLNDATSAAIREAFRQPRSTVGVLAGEGSTALDSKTFENFALYNEVWGGGTVNIDRLSTGRWTIEDGRLTTSLIVQPGVFMGFLERRGKSARDIGFLARMLIAFPPSTQGTRTQIHAPAKENTAKFNLRVKTLLEEARQRRLMGDGPRPLLKFDWQAQRRWDEISDYVERSLGFCGHLADFKDYGSKYADNLARIAAIFHTFEGYSGDISLETLERAYTITEWFLANFKHLFSPPLPAVNLLPAQDAELLKNWLVNQYLEKRIVGTTKKHLAQYGPYRVRPANRLNPALALLENWQVIFPRVGVPNALVQLLPSFVNNLHSPGNHSRVDVMGF